MKRPLRQRWVLWVTRKPQPANISYWVLAIAVMQGILCLNGREFHRYTALFLFCISALLFERLAFTELLKEKDREIEKLKKKSGN
jgi:hypothetical protein